ncbi:hypothetical protein ACEPAG_2984 [Sanghuangporus baumii]
MLYIVCLLQLRQLEPEPSPPGMSSSEETTPVPIDNAHQDKRLSRLERIVTGENSKAAKMKKKKSSCGRIKKSRKPTSPTKPRTLKAASDGLLWLPLEVFQRGKLIADCLSILDLLSLSRLTRVVHNTMLSKNFRPIKKWVLLLSSSPLFPVLAWKNIYPRLNKIRAERRQQEEDRKRAYLWLDVLSHHLRFGKNWEAEHGGRPLMVLADLRELPEARALVTSMKIGASITEEQWKSLIECVFPDKIREFERQYRFGMAVSLITARWVVGLPRLFSTQPGGNMDMDVLAHAASFVAPHPRRIGYKPISTFDEFEAVQRQSTVQETSFVSISLCHDIIEIASFLLRALGFPERTTMAEMEKLVSSFVCKRCDRKPVVAMSWKELACISFVTHFEAETRQYRRLEYLLRKNPRVEMTLIDSHSIHASIPLAERIMSEEEGGAERTTRRILEKGPERLCPVCTNAFPLQRWFAWAHPDYMVSRMLKII